MNELTKIFWITPFINEEEKQNYIKELGYNINFYDKIEILFDELKKLKFTETIIIIDGKIYIQFINRFISNLRALFIIPKFIIFIKNKEQFLHDNNNSINNYFINHPFYNYGKIKTNINELKESFLAFKNNYKRNWFKQSPYLSNNNQYFFFEYLDSFKDKDIPLKYSSLLTKPEKSEIEKFNNFLLEYYTNVDVQLNLFTTDIPIELLIKYYIYLYSKPSNFYSDINDYLSNNIKNYYIPFLPYIKVLYEGIRTKVLPVSSEKLLYRGTTLKQYQIDKINQNIKTRNPGIILLAKRFFSFTKSKDRAIQFMNDPVLKDIRVLFIVEKEENSDYLSSTHADVEKISYKEEEKEVLFFPFTCFEIKSEPKKLWGIRGEYYEIKLTYFDKYLESTKNKIEHLTLKPNWEKIKSEKLIKINNICTNYINKLFENAYYNEDIQELNKQEIKSIIMKEKEFYDVNETQRKELELETDNIIEKTIKTINSKKESLPNWSETKDNLLNKCANSMDKRLEWTLENDKRIIKCLHPEHNELELISDILIKNIKDEKILDECKSKEKAEEVMEIVEKLAYFVAQDIYNSWKRYLFKNIQIRSIVGNKNLDIEGGKELRNGIKIHLWDAHGDWNQVFEMKLNKDGSVSFEIFNYCLNVGGEAKNGTQINMWHHNESKSQKFYIEDIKNGWFKIHSALNQDYCIDVNGFNSSNGTKIQLWYRNDSDAQKFRFIE